MRLYVGLATLTGRSRFALWAFTFVPLAGLYLATLRTPTTIANFDPAAVSPSAWAIAHHGTPVLPLRDWPALNQWYVPEGGGQVVSNRSPGLVFMAVPFYFLVRSADADDQMPSAIVAALATAAAMAVLALVVRRIASPRAAWAAALIAGTATTTWTVSGTSLWPHGPDQLFLLIALLGVSGERYARGGFGFAASVLTRPPLAVIAAVTGLYESWRRRSWRPALVIGAWSTAGLGVFLVYSAAYWHGGIDSQYAAVGGHPVATFFDVTPDAWWSFAVNVFGTFAALGHGILTTSPFLIPLAAGLPVAWRKAPGWARSTAIGGIVYLAVQLKANRFNGGEGFWGYRYPLPMLTLAAPLLVLAWREWVAPVAKRNAAFMALVIISIADEVIGATCFATPDYYNHVPGLQKHMAWLPANLNGVLTGPRAVPAAAILAAGTVLAVVVYRRMSRTSDGPYVSDVARSDNNLFAFAIED
ncbi:MAG TPA: hypothetical protein VKQ07_02560 [Jatrophihabitantaceae bacterium]|nr:hypothetical protein [Jatrophihabitantaceae bacterium]